MTRNSFNGQGIGLWFSAQVLTCPSFFFSSAMMSLPNFSFQMGSCAKKFTHSLRFSLIRETDTESTWLGAKARPGDLRGVWPISHSCIYEVSNINPILPMGFRAKFILMNNQVGDVLEFRI